MKSIFLLGLLLFAGSVFGSTPTANIVLNAKNTVTLRGPVNYNTAADVFYQAKQLSLELGPKEPLFLVIDSPGGSIVAGLELIRNLQSLGRKVHTVTIFGASMAFITGQSLGARLVTADGVLMSHKASGTFAGEFPGQLDSRYNFYTRVVRKINQSIAERTKGVHNVESYERLIENEYWCSGADCAGQGFVDYVVTARCDKSLSGAESQTDNVFLFGITVAIERVYDKCPLNSGALSTKVTANGEVIIGPNVNEIVPLSSIPGADKVLPEIEKIINNHRKISQ